MIRHTKRWKSKCNNTKDKEESQNQKLPYRAQMADLDFIAAIVNTFKELKQKPCVKNKRHV